MIDWFSKYLLNTYYMPDAVLDIEDAVNKVSVLVKWNIPVMEWTGIFLVSRVCLGVFYFCFVLSMELENSCSNVFMYMGMGGPFVV